MKLSYWAAPIEAVLKSDQNICICGDYKVTVHQVAKLDTYPLEEFVFALGYRSQNLTSRHMPITNQKCMTVNECANYSSTTLKYVIIQKLTNRRSQNKIIVESHQTELVNVYFIYNKYYIPLSLLQFPLPLLD